MKVPDMHFQIRWTFLCYLLPLGKEKGYNFNTIAVLLVGVQHVIVELYLEIKYCVLFVGLENFTFFIIHRICLVLSV